jgi:hypothetical protein
MADFGAAFLAKADLNSAADMRRLRAHASRLADERPLLTQPRRQVL